MTTEDILFPGDPSSVTGRWYYLNLVATPSDDLRGDSTTALAPYTNMRPSETETTATIATRTAAVQAAIDAATLGGGGVVQFPPGLFQINQIEHDDRVVICGSGVSKTVLLAADGGVPSGEFLIQSVDYTTQMALFNADRYTAPLYLIHDAKTNMEVRDLTVDGNGRTMANQSVWDFNPEEPNAGNNVGGIGLIGASIKINNVRICNCSGVCLKIDRGSKVLQNNTTSADQETTDLRYIEVFWGGANGVEIGRHPDGKLDYLSVHGCENGAGLLLECYAWHIDNVHTFGNKYGTINRGLNYFGTLQDENNYSVGYLGAVAGDLSYSSEGTEISRFISFDNCRKKVIGTHTGADDANTLTDSAKSWDTSEWVGDIITNTTKNVSGTITANDANTITATLSSGDWDQDDTYCISGADFSGQHTAEASSTTVLTDSTKDWPEGLWIGATITNLSNGATGRVSASTATTVTSSALSGSESWEEDDTYHLTPSYSVLNAPHFIESGRLDVIDEPHRTGMMLNNGAAGSKVHMTAEASIANSVVLNMQNCQGGKCDINLGGWMGNHDDVGVLWFYGGAPGNRIDLRYGGLTGSGTNYILLSTYTPGSGARRIDPSNRIRVFYDSSTVALSEALNLGTSELEQMVGRHTTGASQAILADTTASWTADFLIGRKIINLTDLSSTTITDNTSTTITGVLAGGDDNDWDVNDVYLIEKSPSVELIPY